MSFIKSQIPNLFTAGNLILGVTAIILTLEGRIDLAPYCLILAAVLDFFDGFVARLLNVSGELGKQLDSLADMVSFGVAPGIMMYQIIKVNVQSTHFLSGLVPEDVISSYPWSMYYLNDLAYYQLIDLWVMPGLSKFLPLAALALPFFALFRLAKFNIDTNQTDKFIGIPTPAMTIVVIGISFIIVNGYSNTIFGRIPAYYIYDALLLSVSAIILGLLMVSKIELISFKFKTFTWKDNQLRFIFLTISVILLATLFVWALPIIVLLYIILSLFNNMINKSVKDEIQS